MNAYQAVIESRWFSLDEWLYPETLHDVDARVIWELDRLRAKLGRPIHPSKHIKGWARYEGSKTSQHYAVDRTSTAGDIFPEGQVLDCWLLAITGIWGGVGLYLDTNRNKNQPGPMMHVDLREGPKVLWVRDNGHYVYHHEKPDQFWDLVEQVRRDCN